MSHIIVSAREIESKKNSLVTLNHSLKNQIHQMETLGNSLNAMWEGEAKQSYVKRLGMDIGKLKLFMNAIEEFINVLSTIIQIYKMMEQKNISTATS